METIPQAIADSVGYAAHAYIVVSVTHDLVVVGGFIAFFFTVYKSIRKGCFKFTDSGF